MYVSYYPFILARIIREKPLTFHHFEKKHQKKKKRQEIELWFVELDRRGKRDPQIVWFLVVPMSSNFVAVILTSLSLENILQWTNRYFSFLPNYKFFPSFLFLFFNNKNNFLLLICNLRFLYSLYLNVHIHETLDIVLNDIINQTRHVTIQMIYFIYLITMNTHLLFRSFFRIKLKFGCKRCETQNKEVIKIL